ncbi:M6 family metalloprotease domain-containing protein [Streptomyces sp. NPDC005955]|uniref:M6 family metalloprotease domain-containing protein n=1 Tax=Streptomyces sp. NPDC005955 TaxID=3364738 RepID=UPI0036CA45A1
MPPQSRTGGARGVRRGRSWARGTAAATSLAALAATSLVAGPAVAESLAGSCALERSEVHHSEGLDTWNAAYPRPGRRLDALMVFLAFPDARPLTSPGELAADYFPATDRFYRRASYGRFTLRPHPREDWITMPRPSTAYAIERDWDAEHRTAYLRDAVTAADPHVDFGAYDLVYFVADPDAPGVDSDATKVVNFDRPLRVDGAELRRIVTVFERHPPDRNVLAHETGHVFDLPDLYHRPKDGEGDWDTHVGDWDVMGSQFGLAPDLFAWHKWKLGWLDPGQVVCVEGRGEVRLALEPVSVVPTAEPGASGDGSPIGPDADGRASDGVGAVAGPVARVVLPGSAPVRATGPGYGTKLAVVRTGRTSAIAVEARQAVGNDRSTCTEGVLVYRVASAKASGAGPVRVVDGHPGSDACGERSVYPPLADAPLGAGEGLTVTGERLPVRVEVGERTSAGEWAVRISAG